MMHPATKLHVVAMIGMIRQACSSIETVLNQEDYIAKKKEAIENPKPDEENFLTEEQENMIGKMMGLIEPDDQILSKPVRSTAPTTLIKPKKNRLDEEFSTSEDF